MDYVLIHNKNIIFICHKLFNKISDASKAYRMDKESILRIQCATFLLYTLNWSHIFIKLDTSHLVKQLHTPRFRKVVSTPVHCGFNTLFLIYTNNSKLCKSFRSLAFLARAHDHCTFRFSFLIDQLFMVKIFHVFILLSPDSFSYEYIPSNVFKHC
jgi:hypothetical protein